MSTSRSLAGLLGAVAAVVLALPPQADAACDLYQTIPDGRFRGPYTISSGTNDVAMRFMGVLGKSYSVEAIVENAPFNAVANPSFSLNWGPAASTCPLSNVAGLRRTESIDPSSDLSPTNYFRGSFTAPSSTTFYTFRIGNTSATAVTISVSVSETTLYSPAWSTNGTYDTFYSLLNTTRAACSGTLILFDTAGTAVSTASLTIPAGGTASTNTSTMATGRNSAGTARFTHDCPPGAFLAEAAIASFAISPPYFQFVHFEGTREAKTH